MSVSIICYGVLFGLFSYTNSQQYACGRLAIASDGRNSIQGPPSLPKSNLEASLDPLLTSAFWLYDLLQPRTDLFVNTVQNISVAFDDIKAHPTGSTTVRLISYYAGYAIVATAILLIAVVWPFVGLLFCCCRCCCHRCCYGHRGDIYSTTRKSNGSCRRCGCGFLFFIILILVMGACLGCFISSVIFRLNVTSSTSLDAAAEATSSAYNKQYSGSSLLITDRFGASILDVIDSLQALGANYASILRRHVAELTDSMMGGVQDIVQRLSNYLDNEWLGGANRTLEATRILQQNITSLVNEMTVLITKHGETRQLVETCVYNAQRLKSDINSACSETVSRECSQDLLRHLSSLDGKVLQLKKIFDDLPQLDEQRIRDLERQRVGDKADALLSVYARDLDRIQNEAFRIASSSSVRRSIFTTLNNSLGVAADLLVDRTTNLASSATDQMSSWICSNNDIPPKVAKYVRPSLDYTFYGLMGIAAVIAFLVLFMGLAMLAACAGRSYYKRASCFTITSIAITFFFAVVLASGCLAVFLTTALMHSEVCRPIVRQDAMMFKIVDDYITQTLADVADDVDSWPPELIFASSSSVRATLADPWSFSFGATLASCLHKNASLMTALQLRLPHSRLADRLISSTRAYLKQATDDAILKVQSQLDDVNTPIRQLQESLRELTNLQLADWQLPQYPSVDSSERVDTETSIARLTDLVSREVGPDSAVIRSLKLFGTNCQSNLFNEHLPLLFRTASSVELRSKMLGSVAMNVTGHIDAIVVKILGSSENFRSALLSASRDLGNYLELTARKKLAEFEIILATDDGGRCYDSAAKVLAASDIVCRPIGILAVYSILLVAVVLVAVPLTLCIGAPFGQSLQWPSSPIIAGNPQITHAPGFEGLPLLDLLPRYQKIG